MTTEIPGKQHQTLGFSRSIGFATKLRWALRRLVLGSVAVPSSAVFVQYNKRSPIVHRLVADRHNTQDVKLMGIEVLRRVTSAATPLRGRRDVEFSDSEFEVQRLKLAPHQSTHTGPLASPALCVTLTSCRPQVRVSAAWTVSISSTCASVKMDVPHGGPSPSASRL